MPGITLFLCGDVMTGRGVDQVLPHPGDARIHEAFATSARSYVELAEHRSGPVPRPVDFAYVWGDALGELDRRRPDVRIVNLETAITTSDEPWPGKGIHYRMHPANAGCLSAARIDCCALANNHVLDWGRRGLAETLATLRGAGIASAGAGPDAAAAAAPAVIEIAGAGRVVVLSFGTEDSGIPPAWAASAAAPGVTLLADLSDATVRAIARRVDGARRGPTVVVASIHWGDNWGYAIPRRHREFAHRLIDAAGVDVVHGHSSHHPKAIEVYRDRLILYGCGDFLNDYEGIGGYEEFRGDLALMYFARLDARRGRLLGLDMWPGRVRRFRIERATPEDGRWLGETLGREGRALGTGVRVGDDGGLALSWGGRA